MIASINQALIRGEKIGRRSFCRSPHSRIKGETIDDGESRHESRVRGRYVWF